MLNALEIQHKLTDRNLSAVARASGVSYATVLKLASGQHNAILYSSVAKVSQYLENLER